MDVQRDRAAVVAGPAEATAARLPDHVVASGSRYNRRPVQVYGVSAARSPIPSVPLAMAGCDIQA